MVEHRAQLAKLIATMPKIDTGNTANTTLGKRAITGVQINASKGNTLFSFQGGVSVGTPNQDFEILFDTGSQQLWLQAASIRGAASAGNKFDCSKSSTCKPTGENAPDILYVDGTQVRGQFVRDNVAVAGLAVPNLKFEQATLQTTGNNRTDLDGVMGLAFLTLTVWEQYWDQLVKRNNVDTGVFGYYIDETDSVGGISFGGIDASRFAGTLNWFPVSPA
ncbi:1,3-beta-glucanosyltransferase, partial [Borealophlyctis nickersoniae]